MTITSLEIILQKEFFCNQTEFILLFVPFPSRNYHFDVWSLKHEGFFSKWRLKHENRKFLEMAKTFRLKTLYTLLVSLKTELSEGEEVVYLMNFCILIVSAFMKTVKQDGNVEH